MISKLLIVGIDKQQNQHNHSKLNTQYQFQHGSNSASIKTMFTGKWEAPVSPR